MKIVYATVGVVMNKNYKKFCLITGMADDSERTLIFFEDFCSYNLEINEKNILSWTLLVLGNK